MIFFFRSFFLVRGQTGIVFVRIKAVYQPPAHIPHWALSSFGSHCYLMVGSKADDEFYDNSTVAEIYRSVSVAAKIRLDTL